MATEAQKSQVAAKWQECFQRLNADAPGISGLMSFSEVSQIDGQKGAFIQRKLGLGGLSELSASN